MQSDNAWSYGPNGLPVEDLQVHTQPTLVLRNPPIVRRRFRGPNIRQLAVRFLIALAVLLVLCLGTGVYVWYDPMALATLSGPLLPAAAGTVPWNGTDPINILALGVDQRVPGEQDHSDTIIVITLDPGKGTVRMVSIPRDLAVSVPGYGEMSKINEGNYLGGPRYEAYTIEHALGIPINYYITLQFSSFQHLIDVLGGVNIDVDQNINDPTYPAMVGNGYAPLVLHKGMQHMDGATALAYMRERHAYTAQDAARVQHQQQLITAVKSEVFSVHTIFHLPSILAALRNSFVTNLPDNLLPVVAMDMLKGGNVDHVYFNDQNGMTTECVGGDLGADLCPTPAFAPQIQTLFADPKLASEHASVWVENGTTLNGEAQAIAQTLQTCKVNVVGTSSADNADHTKTEVIINSAQPPAPYTARLLRQMFDAQVTSENLPNISAQVVLLLGSDVPQVQ
jgi:LCP family protein required for cell wall assembly